jgi:hypothetical protein
MYGGDFSDVERKELIALGFSEQDLIILEQHNITNVQLIRGTLQQINPETGNNFTPEGLIQSLHEAVNEDANEDMNVSGISDISNDSDEQHNLNISGISNDFDNDHNLNDHDDDGSLHLSHLDESNASDNNTTRESFGSVGGKRRRRSTKKNKRKTRKNKRRKSIKQRGGQCYGRGVGANTYDPSFSIYNTNELQLFPYKPTN